MTTPDAQLPLEAALAGDAVLDDCWNRIGIRGDQSCGKLVQHVHCRNCEVYAGAAQRNLQRHVDAGYKDEWASHFRGADQAAENKDSSGLVFRIGREWLSLPTRMFMSVAPQAKPHALPHRGGKGRGLLGIVNVGGTLYPCMSLAALLGVDESDVAPTGKRHTFARLLVIQWEEQAYALPVADLHGILRYSSAAVKAPAATINKGLSRFLSGVLTQDDMRIGCLDAALVGYQLARNLR
jgi:chemotaxis-related protein WspD